VLLTFRWLNTFSATSDAPGAVPSMRRLQGPAGRWALNPDTLYTCVPCPAIALASRNASPPAVAAVVPSPLKSW
jgi:hypothetical protein